MSEKQRSLWLAVLGISVVAVLAIGLERRPGAEKGRLAVHSRSLPTEAFGPGRLTSLLKGIGVLRPGDGDVPPPGGARTLAGRPGPSTWRVGSYRDATIPSTTAVPPDLVASGLRIVSLAMPSVSWSFLGDHPEGRGRAFEQPAWLSLFEGGDVLFASPVGIRVHGKATRRRPLERGYRLYFHDAYGAGALPAATLGWQGGGKLKKLVVLNSFRDYGERGGWHIATPLGYDISRRLGVPTPRTAPTLLVVNGRNMGLFFLTEALDESFLHAWFGHSEYAVHGLEGSDREDHLDLYQRMYLRAKQVRRAKHAREFVDLDSWTSWLIASAYCGNTDWGQGRLVRDLTKFDGRWTLVTWDMDHCFVPAYADGPVNGWDVNILPSILEQPFQVQHYNRDPRKMVLRKLWRYDRRFRNRLRADIDLALEERLTLPFLEARLDHYVDILKRYGVTDLWFVPHIEEFFRRRPDVFRSQFEGAYAFRDFEIEQRKRLREE